MNKFGSLYLNIMPILGSDLTEVLMDVKFISTKIKQPISFIFNDVDLTVSEFSDIDELVKGYLES